MNFDYNEECGVVGVENLDASKKINNLASDTVAKKLPDISGSSIN